MSADVTDNRAWLFSCTKTVYFCHLQDYHFQSSLGKNVIFLSDQDQLKMKNSFVESLPWHSFGRKNIGYLFAIANGAKVIWDFDDDNIIKFWMKGAVATDGLLEIDQFASQEALKSELFHREKCLLQL